MCLPNRPYENKLKKVYEHVTMFSYDLPNSQVLRLVDKL